MGFQYSDGTKLPTGVAFATRDGVQRSRTWLKNASQRDLELNDISWVAEPRSNHDQRFYWSPTDPKQLNDEPAVDEDGNELGYTQTGLKTLWKAKQNEIAASLLAPSDWRVVKELEVNSSFSAAKTAFPTEWQTYRAAVRTACNTRQTEIDNCSDVAALKELLFGSAQIQQTDDDGNAVEDADGNPVMIDNPNIATAWPDPVE
ncbi:MAG: hypothetical protein DWQ28_08315 [Proteobacteria bacterium]|nr:MAG: hypothetical protein DWQ28_08315 [Pseudomonadota bacterium]